MPRNIEFESKAFKELSDWLQHDVKLAKKIIELLDECTRTPFEGKGKPEGLKGNLKGFWSRRINQEHRLIYRVTDEIIYVLSCYGHYAV